MRLQRCAQRLCASWHCCDYPAGSAGRCHPYAAAGVTNGDVADAADCCCLLPSHSPRWPRRRSCQCRLAATSRGAMQTPGGAVQTVGRSGGRREQAGERLGCVFGAERPLLWHTEPAPRRQAAERWHLRIGHTKRCLGSHPHPRWRGTDRPGAFHTPTPWLPTRPANRGRWWPKAHQHEFVRARCAV